MMMDTTHIDAPSTTANLIYPPPEIKSIVEKTAGFVAKHGPGFEEKIREKEMHNAKFCFLNPTDPYRPYYDHRLTEIREGRGGEDDAKQSALSSAAATAEQHKSSSATALPEKRAPVEPPPFEFLLDIPAISAQDLDILKLTAQFVARNGRSFIASLVAKEAKNHQFDFLKPSHGLYLYFGKLVEQYSKIMVPSTRSLVPVLEGWVKDKDLILERIMTRVEYKKYQNEKKRRAEEEDEEDRIAFASIDWHDCTLLDTIEFTETDDVVELALPVTLVDLQNATLLQRKGGGMLFNTVKDIEIEMEDEEEMDMDDDDDNIVAGGGDPKRQRTV